MSSLNEIQIERQRYFEALRINQQARQEDTRRKEYNQKQEQFLKDRLKDIEFKHRAMRRMSGKAKIRARNQINQMEKELKAFKESIRAYAPNRELAEESSRLREIRLRVERLEPKRLEQMVYRDKVGKMMEQVNRGEKSIGQAMADAKASIQIRGLDGATRQGFDAYLRQNHPKIADQYIQEEGKARMKQMHQMNKEAQIKNRVKQPKGIDRLKHYQGKQLGKDYVKQRAPQPTQNIPKEKKQGQEMEI